MAMPRRRAAHLGLTHFDISLTHSRTDAMAFVVALRGEPVRPAGQSRFRVTGGVKPWRKFKVGVQTLTGEGRHCYRWAVCGHLVPRRSFGAHKWGVGGVVIVGGAPGYLGAPMLSAMAAHRAGAGIVSLAVPRGMVGTIATASARGIIYSALRRPSRLKALVGRRKRSGPNLRRRRPSSLGLDWDEDEASDGLMAALFGAPSASSLIGFGSASSAATKENTAGLLAASEKPIVIDADGSELARQAG